jgi:hypothetical protein
MTLDEFVTAHNGQYVNFDQVYGPQCMDLYRVYVRDVLGFEQSKGVANAWQVYYNYPAALWERIPNGPTNYPQPGDVVIWSRWYSRSLTGHIAICVDAGDSWLTCFSQNDPGGSPCILKEYGYRYVLGWLRPRA